MESDSDGDDYEGDLATIAVAMASFAQHKHNLVVEDEESSSRRVGDGDGRTSTLAATINKRKTTLSPREADKSCFPSSRSRVGQLKYKYACMMRITAVTFCFFGRISS